jgi:hypothetical protein
MKIVFTIITIYFVFVLSEIIVLPIIMTIVNIPPQVMLILLSPIFILAILGFILTVLSNKYYRQIRIADNKYQQSKPAF